MGSEMIRVLRTDEDGSTIDVTADEDQWTLKVHNEDDGIFVEASEGGLLKMGNRDALPPKVAAILGLQLLAASGTPLSAARLPDDLVGVCDKLGGVSDD